MAVAGPLHRTLRLSRAHNVKPGLFSHSLILEHRNMHRNDQPYQSTRTHTFGSGLFDYEDSYSGSEHAPKKYRRVDYKPKPPFAHEAPTKRAPDYRQDPKNQKSRSAKQNEIPTSPNPPLPLPIENAVEIEAAGSKLKISSLMLRDMCECPRCVDVSTRQKLFSTVDIPPEIKGFTTSGGNGEGKVCVTWDSDISGYDDHTSTFDLGTLSQMLRTPGTASMSDPLPERTLWSAEEQRAQVADVAYEAYMSDDFVLYRALQQLHTHGLLFLTDVPESEASVSTIAERIGPLKNTFYGSTWDVRSVPQAKNVAYTSQDLGFHMDLLYMRQPPHLQFLHCIRSSAAGGASLFTDSFRAASDLSKLDPSAFNTLMNIPTNYHYNHLESHYYEYSHRVIEAGSRISRKVRPMSGATSFKASITERELAAGIRAMSWAPPFQGPFLRTIHDADLRRWHMAASALNALFHRPDGIYERMMKPGECVIFDNRRVLHARKAFEVGDAGKERWLRGAYLDRDPYLSKLKVLGHKFRERDTPAAGA